MAFVLADRVKETCSSPGTGTATLLGAATGYQTFSAGIGANNTTYYTIADQGGANWEVGYGTIGAGGTTLARTTVLASSNSGSLVNFASGTQDVFCDYPAGKAVIADSANALRVDGQAYVDYESAPATTVAAGRMWYNNTLGNWNLGMGGGNITQQVGEELFVYGKASTAITDSPLRIIYQTGTVGASGVITFAPTIANITDGNKIIGVATENITLNSFGRVTTFGVIHNITTDGSAYGETWADGDEIWYNPVTGNPTKTKPSAPNIKVSVGIVINAGSGGSGSFQVEINHGSVLGGTDSNVQLNGVTNGNILTYDGTNTYWKNTDLAAGTGISVSKSATGVLTVTNTSPSSGGTVTSVSGTAPISVANGTTTPAITISQASTSTNGYLSSTDWNTFNNKGSGTVTSVSALTLGTTGTDLSSTVANSTTTPVITLNVPTASATNRGALSAADWTTFNSKASPFTYTSTYIPYGQGTTTPNQSSSLTFDGTIQLAPIQGASNGIVVNNRTIGTSYSIPSGYSATSAGPITISSGVTVTVPTGGKWVVL